MFRPIRERINLGLSLAGVSCAAAWLLALGCSSGGPKEAQVEPVGCDPAVDAVCGAVGATCQSDTDCSSGTCSAGACSSAGVDGSGGSSGSIIDGSGFLVDDLGESRPRGEQTCVDLDVDFRRITPTVALLIDQSGSMSQPFENGRDRWQTLRETLTDPESSFLKKLDTSVRFGMTLYTSDNGFGSNPDNPRVCPKLQSVGIQPGNFQNITNFLELKNDGAYVYGPSGDTPTPESVDAVLRTLRSYTEEGPKSIILATDGDPDTCADPKANDDSTTPARRQAAKDASVAAVTAAYQAGIPTHIISVGNETTATHLKALAVAGAGGNATAEAYTALDTSALEAAFDAIIGSVRTCDFTLEGKVTPANAPRGKVIIDGQEITFGDANGWQMPDDQTVRLNGTACSSVQADAAGVSMKFPCDAITILR